MRDRADHADSASPRSGGDAPAHRRIDSAQAPPGTPPADAATDTPLRALFRTATTMAIVLAVPILPFLLFGQQMEAWLTHWAEDPPSRAVSAGMIVLLLSTDILLPIPSSVISTMGGWQLGALLGTGASFLGMSVGAALGFALARRWGRPLALRFSKADDLARVEAVSIRYAPLVLVLARGVPVFAEATVLLLGMQRLSWRRFLPPVLLANLGISLAYSAFGDVAREYQWLPIALAVSVALPVLLAGMVRYWLPAARANEKTD